jgi:flagellar motor switch protein FliN/FliY
LGGVTSSTSASPGVPSAQEPAPSPLQENITGGANKLGLLMDVELGVILRFGGKHLLLREILELGPGSVVELDRQVQEPADLLLDDRLIARGEVVVVEGSYGLRVTEVLSPPSPG